VLKKLPSGSVKRYNSKNMNKNVKFGIVQGRLIRSPKDLLQWFPQDYWESEFFLASSLGYSYVELIAETNHNEHNPIWADKGIKKINELCVRNNLTLEAICNDFIISHSILENNSVLEQNSKFIKQAKKLGMKKIILPFFEESEITEKNYKDYKDLLVKSASVSQEYNMLLCIETNLDGGSLINLIEHVNHPNLKVVFDTGNRIALRHNIYSDIRLLRDLIMHVHIKDKNSKNENVHLGTGNVNFLEVFKSFSEIDYKGPYTFETCRGRGPIKTAGYNKQFVEFFLNEAGNGI